MQVARYRVGGLTRFGSDGRPVGFEVNGEPVVLARADAACPCVFVPEVGDGVIIGIRIIVNPNKLSFGSARAAHLAHSAEPPIRNG